MLYKYRSLALENFKYNLDILVNQRLYATTYDNMNDPMEGKYTSVQDLSSEIISAFENHHKNIKFSSLSKVKDNPLMWAHYANGARGIVIGLELKNGAERHDVKYNGLYHLLENKDITKEKAKSVLCYKNEFWEYEKEVRVFVEKSNYVDVNVKQVIFGEKAGRTEKSILKKIIARLTYKIEVLENGASHVK